MVKNQPLKTYIKANIEMYIKKVLLSNMKDPEQTRAVYHFDWKHIYNAVLYTFDLTRHSLPIFIQL